MQLGQLSKWGTSQFNDTEDVHHLKLCGETVLSKALKQIYECLLSHTHHFKFLDISLS